MGRWPALASERHSGGLDECRSLKEILERRCRSREHECIVAAHDTRSRSRPMNPDTSIDSLHVLAQLAVVESTPVLGVRDRIAKQRRLRIVYRCTGNL
jgi:hypothetical protein